jgi:predicted short-subunit dehydrogenase-like oxidoreductase (DUF2520 family)
MRISIIGTGNLAHFFAKGITSSPVHGIAGVYARSQANAVRFAQAYNCGVIENLFAMPSDTDMVLLCVPDSAIGQLKFSTQAIVAHCSGTVGLEVLRRYSDKAACIWPIYSIRAQMDFLQIPIAISASENCIDDVIAFSNSISGDVSLLNEQQKTQAHLVATIGNNFTNFLFAELYKFCQQNEIPQTLFQALFKQSLTYFASGTNAQHQTGPAARGDEATIAKHQALLNNSPKLLELYTVFTKQIMNSAQ